jgi:hypothetical protein
MVQSHGTPGQHQPPSSWSKFVRRFMPVTIAYVPKKPTCAGSNASSSCTVNGIRVRWADYNVPRKLDM